MFNLEYHVLMPVISFRRRFNVILKRRFAIASTMLKITSLAIIIAITSTTIAWRTEYVAKRDYRESQLGMQRVLLSALPSVSSIYSNPEIISLREKVVAGKASKDSTWVQVKNAASRELLNKTIPSIPDKTVVPPSGDKRDYHSWLNYVWFNAETGKYEYRDGQFNTEQMNLMPDDTRFWDFSAAIQSGAMAWFLSGDSTYATPLASLVRRWMVDAATRMNPNLTYAAYVEGYSSPTRTNSGIINLNGSYELWDAFQIVLTLPNLTSAEKDAVTAWLNSMYTWLTTDAGSLKESKTKNNHSMYWNLNVVSLAATLGKTVEAKSYLEAVKPLIASQVLPTGEMPEETKRTLALGYTYFNLRAMAALAHYGARLGVDLWGYETADGRSIKKALAYAEPFARETASFPFQQVSPLRRFDYICAETAFRLAAATLGESYAETANSVATKHGVGSWRNTFLPAGFLKVSSVKTTATATPTTKATPKPTPKTRTPTAKPTESTTATPAAPADDNPSSTSSEPAGGDQPAQPTPSPSPTMEEYQASPGFITTVKVKAKSFYERVKAWVYSFFN